MERRFAETVLDNLSDQDYHWLHMIALRTTEQLVDQLVERKVLDPTDSDPKPGEIDDEPEHRVAALRRVKAAQVAGALLADVANEITANAAAKAVWLGASLADLGSASGSTRQAARKRWPDLGQIYRMRRWLSGHSEDIRVIAMRLIEVRKDVWPRDDVTPSRVATVYSDLKVALVRLDEDIASGSMVVQGETNLNRVIRWQRMSELVDLDIRNVVEAIRPNGEASDFAISGAVGLLAHYDAVSEPTTP
jgi:hypothetical protein